MVSLTSYIIEQTKLDVPGHVGVNWHDIWSSLEPLQGSPPLAAAGFEHDRSLVICPLPLDTLQLDHTDQADHSPSTKNGRIKLFN